MLNSPTIRTPVRRSTDETYRRYRLIAGQRGDGFSAVAYAGTVCVFTGSGCDLDGAIYDLKSQIDRDFDRRASERSGELPSREELELALALASTRITPALHHLLQALCHGPEISPQLVQRRSGASEETLMRDLVRLARSVADILSLPLPKGTANVGGALKLIGERVGISAGADETWIFRPAFVAAAEAHLVR
ncbi:hypothetical protein GS397_26360 (plasmid) [Sphingobium yanoikuyae]|uniref:Uncharacterized protein n=1 Tax=Sphingobium yanoikuyae TaxID=13690 RepID=A0A6P1GPW0_SPHYA|nr:hypothetical protein [Sphingobium yanoikuyae]QHD70635.1 hypothetical protein GS397_26360 [Sphingobium yanoikuyae]